VQQGDFDLKRGGTKPEEREHKHRRGTQARSRAASASQRWPCIVRTKILPGEKKKFTCRPHPGHPGLGRVVSQSYGMNGKTAESTQGSKGEDRQGLVPFRDPDPDPRGGDEFGAIPKILSRLPLALFRGGRPLRHARWSEVCAQADGDEGNGARLGPMCLEGSIQVCIGEM